MEDHKKRKVLVTSEYKKVFKNEDKQNTEMSVILESGLYCDYVIIGNNTKGADLQVMRCSRLEAEVLYDALSIILKKYNE
jgi:hypothetical protein